MDTFELNKIAGAFLGSLLVLMVVNEVGNLLVHPTEPEETAIAVAVPEGGEAPAEAAPAEPEQPIGVLLASADPAQGERQARKCQACHTFEAGGANKIGPNLHNIVGRDKASTAGFSYSSAMEELEGVWTYEDLNAFLDNPKEAVPGTKMTFAGIKNDEQRADLILYLRQQTEAPPPLPSP